jgi:hypothetical protein
MMLIDVETALIARVSFRHALGSGATDVDLFRPRGCDRLLIAAVIPETCPGMASWDPTSRRVPVMR